MPRRGGGFRHAVHRRSPRRRPALTVRSRRVRTRRDGPPEGRHARGQQRLPPPGDHRPRSGDAQRPLGRALRAGAGCWPHEVGVRRGRLQLRSGRRPRGPDDRGGGGGARAPHRRRGSLPRGVLPGHRPPARRHPTDPVVDWRQRRQGARRRRPVRRHRRLHRLRPEAGRQRRRHHAHVDLRHRRAHHLRAQPRRGEVRRGGAAGAGAGRRRHRPQGIEAAAAPIDYGLPVEACSIPFLPRGTIEEIAGRSPRGTSRWASATGSASPSAQAARRRSRRWRPPSPRCAEPECPPARRLRPDDPRQSHPAARPAHVAHAGAVPRDDLLRSRGGDRVRGDRAVTATATGTSRPARRRWAR